MKLSRTLAPVALAFALVSGQAAFAEGPPNHNDLTCSAPPAGDLEASSAERSRIVEEVLMPAVVHINILQAPQTAAAGDLPDVHPDVQDLFRRLLPQPEATPETGPQAENDGPMLAPEEEERQGLGSGFIVDSRGYIVTNNHVAGENPVTVTLYDSNAGDNGYAGKTYRATLIGADEKTDIALLKIDAEGPLPCVHFGDSDSVRLAEGVLALGSPLGNRFSVSAGMVSSKNRSLGGNAFAQYVQTDAAINRGNSGGPLFNMQGEVIGVNTAILSPNGGNIGLGFSVNVDIVEHVANALLDHGRVPRGGLGVRIQDISAREAAGLGLSSSSGAKLVVVEPNTPADKAGLQAGDIILSIDGRSITNTSVFVRTVGNSPVNEDIEIKFWRDGAEHTTTAVLTDLESITFTPLPEEQQAPAPRPGAPVP